MLIPMLAQVLAKVSVLVVSLAVAIPGNIEVSKEDAATNRARRTCIIRISYNWHGIISASEMNGITLFVPPNQLTRTSNALIQRHHTVSRIRHKCRTATNSQITVVNLIANRAMLAPLRLILLPLKLILATGALPPTVSARNTLPPAAITNGCKPSTVV